ncbi:MAG: hypothetical protein CM1200mP3_01550 [Chloroflexota bacterium]|nr:MAG: hypothetical protein CM1200mP3_01550 [Chloroflexota bacterium]
MSNVCIGHSDDSKDIKYLKKLCESGAFVAFDKLYPVDRHGESPNIEARIENLAILIESGYSHCLFMSHDWSIYAPAFLGPSWKRRIEKKKILMDINSYP